MSPWDIMNPVKVVKDLKPEEKEKLYSAIWDRLKEGDALQIHGEYSPREINLLVSLAIASLEMIVLRLIEHRYTADIQSLNGASSVLRGIESGVLTDREQLMVLEILYPLMASADGRLAFSFRMIRGNPGALRAPRIAQILACEFAALLG